AGVLVDKKGIPRNAQRCTDGDSGCDLDPTPGNCRFHLWACLGADDARLACAATAVTGFELRSPRANAVGTQLAARNAVLDAVGALGLPAGPGETCSGRIEVDVPAGKSLKLATRAVLASGKKDNDSLKLTCRKP